jgi:hypothetical protein
VFLLEQLSLSYSLVLVVARVPALEAYSRRSGVAARRTSNVEVDCSAALPTQHPGSKVTLQHELTRSLFLPNLFLF